VLTCCNHLLLKAFQVFTPKVSHRIPFAIAGLTLPGSPWTASTTGVSGFIHDLYFNPQHEEFQPRTMWSLSNAFTSAFPDKQQCAPTFSITRVEELVPWCHRCRIAGPSKFTLFLQRLPRTKNISLLAALDRL